MIKNPKLLIRLITNFIVVRLKKLYIDTLLAVGFEENFYLFNLISQENLCSLSLSWYFGHLYFEKNFFYVADASGLTCINLEGKTIWRNDELGIDGVSISHFTEDKIYGWGEFDPPGGWEGRVCPK